MTKWAEAGDDVKRAALTALYYYFYHSMSLHHNLGVKGGYRNVSVEEIPVDEQALKIEMIPATYEGVQQIETLNPFDLQQMETTAWKFR